MKDKLFLFSFLCAVSMWLLSFVFGIFINVSYDSLIYKKEIKINIENESTKVIDAFKNNDSKSAFMYILKNNTKNCIINITGCGSFGFVTCFNLMYNGYVTSHIYKTFYYKYGLTIKEMQKTTLPHCFELIGVWLSGAVGLYVSFNIIYFMKEEQKFSFAFMRKSLFYSILSVFITIIAAFVEAFITPIIANII